MGPESSADNPEIKPTEEHGSPPPLFPIVGIGASAGGLEAFTELLTYLPVDTGMAFVLIQHLAPQHESMLTQVLSRATRLPVAEVEEGMKAQANHVYIIPPNTNIAIERGTLHLIPRTSQRGQQMPIDHFLTSLAEDRKDRGIGVILSGTASDGTLGLKAIKAEGGFTFAQDETAKYDGMPKSAIAAGYVDYVLSPRQIAKELARIGRRTMLLNAFQMKQSGSEPRLTLLAITDFTERQRSLEILQEQARMIDLAHDAIIVRSPDGVIKSWNKGATTLYGWSRDEALGKITHLLFKTKFQEPLDVVERKLLNQGEWSGELVHTARNGSQIIVASRQVLQQDDQGKPTAILEINRDITQHMHAEASLRSSEARLRALVNSIDDIVFEVDPQGRCLSAWTGNAGLLGRSNNKQRTHSIEDFLPAQSFPPLREAIERVIKGNKPESVEYSLDLGGSKRWFVARINRIASPENAPHTLSVLVREITPRKEAQIALQQSEERFRLLVEGVKDYAIFGLDTEGRIVSWNSGAERIKGYRREEIIGKHFSVFYPPEDIAAGKPEKDLQVAAAEGRLEDAGSWRVRKDGSRFYANLLISAIHDKDGTLRGFTKITRDITDRKRAEDAVRQLSGHILRLQDQERRRIARELHDSTAQLLTALSMNLSLAGRRPSVALDAQAAKLIAEGEALANQASDEVRSTSHLLHPPDLDAVGLVAAIRWYAARFSERSGISVKLNLPDDLCRMPQDNEIALFRVMQESLTNVQRHSGSKVVRVRITQHDDEVHLEIEDKGHGMAPEVLGNDQQSVERLGVGIAGMRERLKQLGGGLEIVSSPRGTKVRAIVPCPPEEPSGNAAAEREA